MVFSVLVRPRMWKMLVQLHLLLFLCSPSFSQTPPGGNLTFGEDIDVESMDEETSGEEIEEEDIVESVKEVVQKHEDQQEASTDPMEEFEATQKALSDAWKELGDAEVAAEEVKRRLSKWQERWLLTNLAPKICDSSCCSCSTLTEKSHVY